MITIILALTIIAAAVRLVFFAIRMAWGIFKIIFRIVLPAIILLLIIGMLL
ncbi:MAG: hypothetical protein VZR00_07300 [Lachnospiraceae bacterium]|jgi:hypothetical protein|nr:hypothetical protein [Lachnospiraceae bacterium]MEE3461673.1 hypothetical protein [Lachnospiraceae bacterium]